MTSWLDIILGIALAYGGFGGFQKGLISGISSVLGLILGIYFCSKVSPFLRFYILKYTDFDIGQDYFSLVITFFAVWLGTRLLGKMLGQVINMLALGSINKSLGAVFGISKISIISALAITFLSNHMELQDSMKESKIYASMESIGLITLCANLFDEKMIMADLLEHLNVEKAIKRVMSDEISEKMMKEIIEDKKKHSESDKKEMEKKTRL